MRCRLLIWSNQPAFVRAMRSLAHREDLDIVAIARSADAVHRCVDAHHPDVILVDRETEEQHPDAVVRLMGGGAHSKSWPWTSRMRRCSCSRDGGLPRQPSGSS